MSSQHATTMPAVRRLTAGLEENGLLVVALGAFTIVFVVALRRGLGGDGWLALVAGRWIVQHGLPSRDSLTLWSQGRLWTDQQWLAQIALYGIWRLGGIKLAMLVHAGLATGALWGGAWIARKNKATARSITWIAIPAVLAYYPVASVMRPQTFAFPLFTSTLWLLLADARNPSRRVFWTFPLLVLWANLHGSVLLGAALVSLGGIVTLVKERRPTAHALALLLVPWTCVFVSPYALHLPAYYEKVLIGSGFKQLVTEWAPTTLGIVTAPVFALVLGGLFLIGRAGRSIPMFDQLAFAAMAVVAFQAVRNIAWIALVALAVLPPLVDRLRSPVEEPRRLNRILSLVVLGSLLVAVGGVATKPTSWFTHAFPTGAARTVERAAGPKGHVFATSPYADWVLWRDPGVAGRIAFDTRFELMTRSQLLQIARIQDSAGRWVRSVRGFRVFVLGPKVDRTLEHALLRALPVRVAFNSPQVVVLRRTG